MEIFKEFRFEAAHCLPLVPSEHKCGRLHGHSYVVRIYARKRLDPVTGWVMDFADIAVAMKPLLETLNHRYLNEVEGLENPTSEHIAVWLWRRLQPALPALSRVEVCENHSSGVIYAGEDEVGPPPS
jgi:6-pyruvoyltetrahydropterin/6-carboxytetrahydropterin synthase